jgi:hypothetical protein
MISRKTVSIRLAVIVVLALNVGWVIPSQAQTEGNSVFLPLVSGDGTKTDEEAGFIVRITSAEQLEQVLLQDGFAPEDTQSVVQAYQDQRSRVDAASQASPMGYSFRPLACFGKGARALFDVGQGLFSANYLIPHPSGISGYCSESICTYFHSRGPAQAGIYGHSLGSDGFASHIYAQCL